jgi:hypothetical protein
MSGAKRPLAIWTGICLLVGAALRFGGAVLLQIAGAPVDPVPFHLTLSAAARDFGPVLAAAAWAMGVVVIAVVARLDRRVR